MDFSISSKMLGLHLITDSVPQIALLQRVRINHVRTLDTIFFKLSGSECIISSNSANLRKMQTLFRTIDQKLSLLKNTFSLHDGVTKIWALGFPIPCKATTTATETTTPQNNLGLMRKNNLSAREF